MERRILPIRSYLVAVCGAHADGPHDDYCLAELRDYNPAWPGCYRHPVEAVSASAVRKLAMAECKRTCGVHQ